MKNAAQDMAYWIDPEVMYWCGIRLMAHASCGRYSSQVVPELTMAIALTRWDKDHKFSFTK